MRNTWRLVEDHIEIEVKNKNKKSWMKIDKEDFEILKKLPIALRLTPGKYTDYVSGNIFIHRLVMKTPDHLYVDHNNHDGLDNRKENLKNCTHKENMQNRRSFKKAKHYCIRKRNDCNRYELTIVDSKGFGNLYGGLYKSYQDALDALSNWGINP